MHETFFTNDDDNVVKKKQNQRVKKQPPVENIHHIGLKYYRHDKCTVGFFDQVKAGYNSHNVNNKIVHLVYLPGKTNRMT